MSQVLPVQLSVLGRLVPAGATRAGKWWTLSAASWPEIRLSGTDIRDLKRKLEARLEAEMRRRERGG